MAGKVKHMERSKYSYHSKPDFADFHRKAGIKTQQKASKTLLSTIGSAVGSMFKRQKKGDK